MIINVYYGGRGLIEDPTLYVLNKMEKVLTELNVQVNRYNLYECKSTLATLPQSLKEADGVILASHVEWMGIGGMMSEFLDACWLYGDKEKISSIYMAPVVVSSTYGEQDAYLQLKQAWELLGGLPCEGLRTYVEDVVDFECNRLYSEIIEKRAENIYRTIARKSKGLPSSSYAIKQNMIKSGMDLTPQESEQLSKYVSDDIYVKQQKEDIEELTSLFKGMLHEQGEKVEIEFISDFERQFTPQNDFKATYLFMIPDKNKSLYIEVNGDKLECRFEDKENVDVLAKLSSDTLSEIIKGRMTFQRAFMEGSMSAKGNFKTLRMLDQLFPFGVKI